MSRIGVTLLAIWVISVANPALLAQRRTENVVLITLDGARTEEMFGGLDLNILKSITDGRVEDSAAYKKYWASTPDQRRRKLMPFLWGTLLAQHGSIAGNVSLGSRVTVTNKYRVSFPGYAEILTGQAHDDVIKDNDKQRSPTRTVLEYLKQKLSVDASQVAAFASWDTFRWIVERDEHTITTDAGLEPVEQAAPPLVELARLQIETHPWDEVRHDAFTFRFAKAYFETHKPRVVYIAFDETDDWAHEKKYDRLLEAYERTDDYIRQLWEWLASSDQYRGKTAIIITTDHGRGRTTKDWHEHGREITGAESIWMVFASPDSSLRGEWSTPDQLYQNQVAATLAAMLGCDFLEQNPRAGRAITRVLATAASR